MVLSQSALGGTAVYEYGILRTAVCTVNSLHNRCVVGGCVVGGWVGATLCVGGMCGDHVHVWVAPCVVLMVCFYVAAVGILMVCLMSLQLHPPTHTPPYHHLTTTSPPRALV